MTVHFNFGSPPPMWIGDDRHLYVYGPDGKPKQVTQFGVLDGLMLTADDLPHVRPNDLITIEPGAGVVRVVRHRATWWLLGCDRRTVIRTVAVLEDAPAP